MWGKCSQAHFGRFEARPYIHSFRCETRNMNVQWKRYMSQASPYVPRPSIPSVLNMLVKRVAQGLSCPRGDGVPKTQISLS